MNRQAWPRLLGTNSSIHTGPCTPARCHDTSVGWLASLHTTNNWAERVLRATRLTSDLPSEWRSIAYTIHTNTRVACTHTECTSHAIHAPPASHSRNRDRAGCSAGLLTHSAQQQPSATGTSSSSQHTLDRSRCVFIPPLHSPSLHNLRLTRFRPAASPPLLPSLRCRLSF